MYIVLKITLMQHFLQRYLRTTTAGCRDSVHLSPLPCRARDCLWQCWVDITGQ